MAESGNRRGFRTICLTLAAAVCLLLGYQILTAFRSTPVEIGVETTLITEPLTSDGQRVDYFARVRQEYYPNRMATDDNGFRYLVQRVDMSTESRPWHYESVCEQLDLDTEQVKPDLRYEDPYSFLLDYAEREDFDAAAIDAWLSGEELGGDEVVEDAELDEADEDDGAAEWDMDDDPNDVDYGYLLSERVDRPWTLDDLPMMEEWLEKNGPALDALCEAVQKPVFCIPLARENELGSLITVLLPHVQSSRSLARGLQARANYRVGTGDIDGAIDDILACKRLGRHMGQGVTLIHLLVGIAIEGIADAVGFDGSPQYPATREQLQRFVSELDQLPPAATVKEKLVFERYMGLDIVQRMSHGDSSLEEVIGPLEGPAEYLGYMGVDWNVVATRLNDHYDQLIEGDPTFSSPTPSQIIFSSRRNRSKYLADFLGSQLIPGYEASREAEHRRQCAQNLQRIIVAMLLYEQDHKTLPPAMTIDEQGKPLHSWRVLLLPYLGREALYKKIRLDEPWDSEHNRKFHNEVVDVYVCPSVSNLQPGHTTYSVIVGSETPFEAGDGKKLSTFGPSKGPFVFLSERAETVCWMEPDKEIPQADADAGINIGGSTWSDIEPPANGIASPHPGGANFGCRDAGVRFFTETIYTEEFQRMLRGTSTRPLSY